MLKVYKVALLFLALFLSLFSVLCGCCYRCLQTVKLFLLKEYELHLHKQCYFCHFVKCSQKKALSKVLCGTVWLWFSQIILYKIIILLNFHATIITSYFQQSQHLITSVLARFLMPFPLQAPLLSFASCIKKDQTTSFHSVSKKKIM